MVVDYVIPVCPECGLDDEVSGDLDIAHHGFVDWFCDRCQVEWEDDSDNAQLFIADRAQDAP